MLDRIVQHSDRGAITRVSYRIPIATADHSSAPELAGRGEPHLLPFWILFRRYSLTEIRPSALID